MRKTTFIAIGLTAALLTTTGALLPATVYAGDGYRSATTVAVGHRDHRGYDDGRGRKHHGHHYRGHAPYGRAYGYYAPRYSTTYYYYRPYTRYYPAPRYYDHGRSGWEIDLHYYFRD